MALFMMMLTILLILIVIDSVSHSQRHIIIWPQRLYTSCRLCFRNFKMMIFNKGDEESSEELLCTLKKHTYIPFLILLIGTKMMLLFSSPLTVVVNPIVAVLLGLYPQMEDKEGN